MEYLEGFDSSPIDALIGLHICNRVEDIWSSTHPRGCIKRRIRECVGIMGNEGEAGSIAPTFMKPECTAMEFFPLGLAAGLGAIGANRCTAARHDGH